MIEHSDSKDRIVWKMHQMFCRLCFAKPSLLTKINSYAGDGCAPNDNLSLFEAKNRVSNGILVTGRTQPLWDGQPIQKGKAADSIGNMSRLIRENA